MRNSEAIEQQVLQVCLHEIDRSRPYFIALLGDRYGWSPSVQSVAKKDSLNSISEAALLEASTKLGPRQQQKRLSVTALEIEYAAWPQFSTEVCAHFFFRECDYRNVDEEVRLGLDDSFAALHHPDPTAREQAVKDAQRLKRLKERIRKEFPGRVHEYKHCLGDHSKNELQIWGQMFVDKVLPDLERGAEIAVKASDEQSEEQFAFEDFLADKTWNFCGRQDVVQRLVDKATGSDDTIAVLGLVGPPGIGKSAVMAETIRRMNEQQDDSTIVLAHAAGVSPRSCRLEFMLQRWIQELTRWDDEMASKDIGSSSLRIEQEFQDRLLRVGRKHRIVMLIDALDQFEPSQRMRHLAWVSQELPTGVMLITTSQPNAAVDVIADRDDGEINELEPFKLPEASDLFDSICRQHHRDLSALRPKLMAKRNESLEKIGNEHPFAWENPLWLTRATVELNQLNEEDFGVVATMTDTDGKELRDDAKIEKMLTEKIDAMPGDVSSLYEWLLLRAERVLTPEVAQSFAQSLAFSRNGLRDDDLAALLPTNKETSWTPTKLAAVRRPFRGHLRRTGLHGQWNLSHQQLRETIQQLYSPDLEQKKEWQCRLADHFAALPENDPLRQTEEAWHLVKAEQDQRTAKLLLTAQGTRLDGAIEALVAIHLSQEQSVLATATAMCKSHPTSPELFQTGVESMMLATMSWYKSMLLQKSLSTTDVVDLANLLQDRLLPALSGVTTLGVQTNLLRALESAMQKRWTDKPELLHAWSRIQLATADLYMIRGNMTFAGHAYKLANKTWQTLVEQHENQKFRRAKALCEERIGEFLYRSWHLGEALKKFESAASAIDELLEQQPGDRFLRRRRASCQYRMGDLYYQDWPDDDCIQAYRKAESEFTALADETGNEDDAIAAAATLDQLSGAFHAPMNYRNLVEANNTQQQAESRWRRLLDLHPANSLCRFGLSVNCERRGDLFVEQKHWEDARAAYDEMLRLRNQLLRLDPHCGEWLQATILANIRLGYVASQLVDNESAERHASAIDDLYKRTQSIGNHLNHAMSILKMSLQASKQVQQASAMPALAPALFKTPAVLPF